MSKINIKQIAFIVLIIILTIIFFSYNVTICIDTSHYCWLTSLLTEQGSFSQWDVARGIVFPVIIGGLTKVFGNNVISLQIAMYIAYGIMLGTCYLIYKEIKKDYDIGNILKIIIGILATVLVILNPLIFGYYHVLLTEYIAMTACVVLSYCAWKWININFIENKIKYTLYTAFFALSMVFMWHLKQPYVLTVLCPFLISIIISIIKNFNWKNILQRLISTLICIITLVISLFIWNLILEKGNVQIDEKRTSGGFFSKQIISGMSEYTRIWDEKEYSKESVEANTKISQEDKEKIFEIIDEKSTEYKGFILIECAPYRDLESSKEIKVIYTKDEIMSTGEAVKFLLGIFIKNPKSVIDGYVNNYLTTIGLYRAFTDGSDARVTKEMTWSGTYENSFIGYNTYRDTYNDLGVPEHYKRYVNNYIGVNRQIKIINNFMVDLQLISIYEFKLVLIAVPVLFLVSFIWFIVLKIKKKDTKILEILIILYGYSLANILMNAVLGALIDRYVISSYLTANIALIIQFGYIFTLIKSKIKKKG